MEHQALIFIVFISLAKYSFGSDVQTPDGNLKEHVKKIEEMLAEMQAQSQVQEQKNRALLSNILSQLSHTTDELGDLKRRHNETILQLELKDAALSQLLESQNATLLKLQEKDTELSTLLSSHNKTISKLEKKETEMSTNQNATVSDLKGHVKKIDELLAEMQSHSKAREQKYSAVLSSLLSQLTQTTDQLEDLKTSYNITIIKLESTSVKLDETDKDVSNLLTSYNATISNLGENNAVLSNLWASRNATISELDELFAKHNNVVMDMKETKSKLEGFVARPSPNGYIGFYGEVSKGRNVSADETIILDKILYNKGAWYKKTSQTYFVPMNGTYQIWIDFKYRSPGSARRFFIQRNNHTIGQAFGSSSDVHETASTITMAYLQEGESIWVKPNQNVYLDTSCNFGIVLLNAH